MPEINLVDKSLDQYNNQTALAMQIGQTGLSFCIYTPSDNTIRAIRHYKLTNALVLDDVLNFTRETFKKDNLLNLRFEKVKVIYASRKSTLVPDEFFNPAILKKLLEFNQPIDELDEIHFNPIDYCITENVFAVPTYLAEIISNKFDKPFFYNQATPLLVLLNETAKSALKHTVIINLNQEFFDIAVMEDLQLKLCNNFLYVNSTDLLYFILYVCRQLEVDMESASFYLVGEHCTKGELTREISVYLKNINSYKEFLNVTFSPATQNIDMAKFAPLLNLMKCA